MSIERIAVIGAGLMGHGIAQVSAAAGKQVTLADRSLELAHKGKDRIGSNLQRMVDKGRLEESSSFALATASKEPLGRQRRVSAQIVERGM